MEVNRKISLHYENIRRKNEEILKNRKKEIYRNITSPAISDKLPGFSYHSLLQTQASLCF